MRMGIATFLPVRNRMLDGEAPAIVDLMTRFEQAMAGGAPISLHELMADLLSAPASLQESRLLRCLQAWLLGELRQHARALVILERVLAEWTQEVDGPRANASIRWIINFRTYQGMLYAELGRHDLTSRCFREARERLQQITPSLGPTRFLAIPPDEIEHLKELDTTGFTPLLAETMRWFDSTGEIDGVARVANNLGHFYLDLGEPASARYWFERSVELLQQMPNDLQLGYALDSLGLCYQQLGQYDAAANALDEALVRATRMEAPAVQASALTSLGDLSRDAGATSSALECYAKARVLEEQMRHAPGLARIQVGRSILYRRAGQFALALEAASEAQNLIRRHGTPLLQDTVTMHALAAAIMLGRVDDVPHLTDVAGRLALYPARQQEVVGHWYLAVADYRAGQQETAMAHLRRSLTLAAQYRHLHLLALELPVTAEVLQPALEQGICPEAVAGLVQHASRAGLVALLDRAPSAAPVVAAAGRLSEARAFSVELLGLFRIMRGGREIDLAAGRSQKAVSLLKYLLANRGSATNREQILEAIWAEVDPLAADRSFEVTLSSLRKLLDPPDGPSLIVRRGRGYLLNPEIPLDVDADRFARHVERGDWWWRRGQVTSAVAEWRAAEACYGGDFLAEDPYEDWAITERERLREHYLALLLRLGEIALREERYGDAVERANRVLAIDPIRESAYRILMRAHAYMGDRAVALRDYRRCAEVLKRELDEEPMPETRELAAQIRSESRSKI